MKINRQKAIDNAIAEVIADNMRLKDEYRIRTYQPGDSITDLEVVTGEEDPDHWQRIPEVLVEQRHIDMAAAKVREIETDL